MSDEEKQEFIDEAPAEAKAPTERLSVVDALQIELRRHMEVALDFKKKIDEAKTEHKKKFYRKKLVKNNEQAAKVLTALERISASRKAKENDQETGHE